MIDFSEIQQTTPYYFFCPQDLIFQLEFKLKENNMDNKIIESVHGFAFDDAAATKFPKYRKTKAWENLTKAFPKNEYTEAVQKAKEYFEQTLYPNTAWIGAIKTTIEQKCLQNLLLKFYGPTIDADYALEQQKISKARHENMETILKQY